MGTTFQIDNTSPTDAHFYDCSACINKDKKALYNKQYRMKHKEKLKEYSRKYYQTILKEKRKQAREKAKAMAFDTIL